MEKRIEDYIKILVEHPEPIIRWKTNRILLGNDISTTKNNHAWEELKTSPLRKRLLSDQNEDGRIPFHPYNKWFGSHWVLSILADLGYPEGDSSLKPLLEQSYGWLLSKGHADTIKTINGRVRRCASQEGNCIYYSLALGLADERTEELVARLLKWQWEDGGWNCDKRPEATICSFNETLIPLRGLAWYIKATSDPKTKQAVNRAAQVFLKRNLFKRIRTGSIIDPHFIKLHYPCYWHYDYLFALKVMTEAGFIDNEHCTEGLDLLESKLLDDGGFPAEEKYYHADAKKPTGHSRVDWGGISKNHSNPFVSTDAMIVLNKAGRLVI